MVVEQDEHNVVTRLFSLDESTVESANTLFFDGILSAEIISLKKSILQEMIPKIADDYQYVDFSTYNNSAIIVPQNKPLLIDFGTNIDNEINNKFANHISVLQLFNIFEIIAACTYFPLIVLGLSGSLTPDRCSPILLWENVDLVDKKATKFTKIRKIN
jgi:hypothetical protein